MGRSEKNLEVEYWRWRYRDPASGRICRTTFQLSSEQATTLVEAERIAGTLSLRHVVDFEDTVPVCFERDVLRLGPDTSK